jgi:hypothetical protein
MEVTNMTNEIARAERNIDEKKAQYHREKLELARHYESEVVNAVRSQLVNWNNEVSTELLRRNKDATLKLGENGIKAFQEDLKELNSRADDIVATKLGHNCGVWFDDVPTSSLSRIDTVIANAKSSFDTKFREKLGGILNSVGIILTKHGISQSGNVMLECGGRKNVFMNTLQSSLAQYESQIRTVIISRSEIDDAIDFKKQVEVDQLLKKASGLG